MKCAVRLLLLAPLWFELRPRSPGILQNNNKIFQANDKARTGYLAAVQARNLLLQTGLAQQTLATVWNLADIDKVTGNW